MKKLFAMNYVNYLLDIMKNAFVNNQIIILVKKNVLFSGNQMDVMKIVLYNMNMKENIYVLLKKIFILVKKNVNYVKMSVDMLMLMKTMNYFVINVKKKNVN